MDDYKSILNKKNAQIEDNLIAEDEEKLKIYFYAFDSTEIFPIYKEFFASLFNLIGERGDYLSQNDPCVILMHPLNTLK